MPLHRAATRTSRALRWLALLTVTVGGNARAATSPLLKLDLRAWGATGLQEPRDRSPKPEPDGSLTFLDEATLAVTFPVFNPEAKLGTREHPGGSSIVFHTTLVDVHTGQVEAEKNWGSVYLPHTMQGISGERLLVRVDDDLGIYSRDWKSEQHYRLKGSGRQMPAPHVAVSPSGETIYVTTRQALDHEHVDVLANGTMGGGWTGFAVSSVGRDAVSDSNFAFIVPKNKKDALFVLPLKAISGQARKPVEPTTSKLEPVCAEPSFVADDRMVLVGLCDSISLLGIDGAVKNRKRLDGPYLLHEVRVSRDQRSFAVIISRPYLTAIPGEERGIAFHGGEVRVYNTTSLAQVFEREITVGRDEIRWVEIALSPDGSLLALMNGWTLTVYQLAAPDASKPPAQP